MIRHQARAVGSLTLLLLCLGGTSLGLDPKSPLSGYSRSAWLTENGLPQNSVHDIIQTRDGYIWAATEEGLARFNGLAFTVFDGRSTPALSGTNVRALLEDRQGALWVCTATGLLRFADGQFTSYTTGDGLASDDVRAVVEDREGGLWLATTAGLCRFKDGRFSTLATKDGLVSTDVTSLLEDREQALWIGTSDGLSRLKDGKFTNYTAPDGLASNSVSALAQDAAGRLWVGTFHGLSCLDGGRFTNYTARDALPSDRVTALSVDGEGSLWVGTAGGLSRRADGRFSTFAPQEALSHEVILSIFEDREGSLWVGTESGGLHFLKDKKFTTYTSAEGLSSNLVEAVYEDRAGRVWIGTNGGGLNLLEDGRLTAYTTRDGLASNAVAALTDDADGNLWIGTPYGLSRLRGGGFTTYTAASGLADDSVNALHVDRGGALWVATRAGLTRIKAGAFTTYTADDGLADDAVEALSEDREGSLWIGTPRGLTVYKDGRFTSYTTRDGLPGGPVNAIQQGADGGVWIATGAGLARLRGGQLTIYDARAGLPSDAIYSVLEDGRGSLWMSCNKGVFRVGLRQLDDFAAKKTGSVTPVVYGTADGMLTPECSGRGRPSGWRGRDGKLWFSTVRGVAVIDAAALRPNAQPPGVAVEQVRIDDEVIAPARPVELPPGRTRFDFYYAALSYVAPERVRFRYKLEGFDRDWIDGGSRRAAYYTNLPPGQYRFRVMAANDDGVWNEAGASFDFRLRPHFYQTYLFYALSALAAAVLVRQLYRLRVGQVERRFRAVLDERNRLAREIHDNLAQDILGISVQLELVARTMPPGAEATRSHLDRARILVRNSVAEARRYVWDLRSQALVNNDLPTALNETARRLTAETGVQAQVRVSGASRPLPPLVESNLLRITQEAVNNAVKHARADRVLVNLNFGHRRAQLSVRDNGRGFDADGSGGGGHFGLVGMRERAEQVGGTLFVRSRPGEGTEVVAEVPVSF